MKRFQKFILRTAIGILLIAALSFGRVAVKAQAPDVMFSIAWSPNGTSFVTGYSSGLLQIQDATTGRIIHTLTGHTAGVLNVVWSPGGDKLVSTSIDGTVRLWNALDGTLNHVLMGHTDAVTAAVWNEDASKIATGSVEDNLNLRVWDANSGQALPSYQYGTVETMLRSPDGKQIAIAGIYAVAFLDPKTLSPVIGDMEQPEKKLSGYDIFSLDWSPNSQLIATGHANGLVRIWDVPTKRLLHTFQNTGTQITGLKDAPVSTVAFSADGRKLFSLSRDGTFRSWNLASGEMLNTVKLQLPDSYAAYHAAWSPYKARLAFVGDNPAGNALLTTQTSGGVLNVVVPDASSEALQGILRSCAKTDVQNRLIAKLGNNKITDFVNAINQTSSKDLPPACAVDLQAVAHAIQNQAAVK